VLQIQGQKLDQYAKVRKLIDAKTVMAAAVKKDLETRFKDLRAQGKMTIAIAHTQNEAEALKFKDELKAEFPDVEFTYLDPLSLSVSCHIGPGALAVGLAIKY
jgi:fatty acid-binding protein DegV